MGIAERKKREKELRRTEIIDSARRVFLDKGYKDTTINQIAHEAELSPGTIYLYFKDKYELFILLTVELLEDISAEIEELNGLNDFSVKEKLISLKEIFLNIYESDERILNIFSLQPAGEYNQLSTEMGVRIKSATSNIMKSIAAIFEQGMDQGLFRRQSPAALADILWVIFSGTIAWGGSKRLWNGNKDYVRQTVDTALFSLVYGLKHKPELEFNLPEVGYGTSMVNSEERGLILKRA